MAQHLQGLTDACIDQLRARLRLCNAYCIMYSVGQKIPPPEVLWQFFQKGREFFDEILHAYYAFLSTLDYEFLFNYLQL